MNTLDQQRAQYAWERAKRNTTAVGGYREMVKGAPALIMGNGLMATLAYYRSRTGSNAPAAMSALHPCCSKTCSAGSLSARSYPPTFRQQWPPFSTPRLRT